MVINGTGIQKINGQDVLISKLSSRLWLINDVLVFIGNDEFEMTDKDAESFLQSKNDPIFPYKGVDNGYMLHVSMKLDKNEYLVNPNCRMSGFLNAQESSMAKEAYNGYKSRTGI